MNISRAAFNAVRIASNAIFGTNLYHRSKFARAIYNAAQSIHQRINPKYRQWTRFMRENPTAPWFVPEAVEYLEKIVRPGMSAFEWGSGRSTVWLAEHSVNVVSVECSETWAIRVAQMLKSRHLSKMVDFRLTDLTGTRYAGIIKSCVQRFDLVIVDGDFRLECIQAIDEVVLNDGAIVVVDNSDRADLLPLLEKWSSRLIASFDNGIDRTSFYQKRRDQPNFDGA